MVLVRENRILESERKDRSASGVTRLTGSSDDGSKSLLHSL